MEMGAMSQQVVSSREYKAMLRPALFEAADPVLLEAAARLWRDFSSTIDGVALDIDGGLSTIKARRRIVFYDTAKQDLNANHYIFRERRDVDGGTREVTLKFRHPDRYVAQGRTMAAEHAASRAKTKFEEDIKAPFVSLYSFSTTVEIDERVTFETLKDVARLFPDIAKHLDPHGEDRPLVRVNDFTAQELVIAGARFQVGKTPKVDAESGLIVWYRDGRPGAPVAVEFSYRYGNDREEYESATARRAFDVFNILQQLTLWVDPNSTTKTAFVYG
jgi:hypothetical protein